MCRGNAVAPVQQVGQLRTLVLLMGHEGVGRENGPKTVQGVVEVVPHLGEVGQVVGGLALVPGNDDGVDVGEVLVERCPSDTGGVGDARHGHRGQPVIADQAPHGVEDGVTYLSAVTLDRLVPELRHPSYDTPRRGGDGLLLT